MSSSSVSRKRPRSPGLVREEKLMVGRLVKKRFPGFGERDDDGTLSGEVIAVSKDSGGADANCVLYTVRYSDGDEETLDRDELGRILAIVDGKGRLTHGSWPSGGEGGEGNGMKAARRALVNSEGCGDGGDCGDDSTTSTARKTTVNMLPFDTARVFARTLKLKGEKEWREWSKSGQRPVNIPAKLGIGEGGVV